MGPTHDVSLFRLQLWGPSHEQWPGELSQQRSETNKGRLWGGGRERCFPSRARLRMSQRIAPSGIEGCDKEGLAVYLQGTVLA